MSMLKTLSDKSPALAEAFKLNLLLNFFTNFLGTAQAASVTAQSAGPKPPLKWFVFREDCFDTFFTKHDFLNGECIKFTISKLIGYLIIAGAFILKVPQILKILKAKSVDGLNKYMFYIEVRKRIKGNIDKIYSSVMTKTNLL